MDSYFFAFSITFFLLRENTNVYYRKKEAITMMIKMLIMTICALAFIAMVINEKKNTEEEPY